MLDVVLDGCIIYRLLLVLTQRDVLYQKKKIQVLRLSLVNNLPLLVFAHPFVYHRRCVISAILSVVKHRA